MRPAEHFSMIRQHDSGFSAVELLISLFIAVLFLAAGHQLFTTIMLSSGESQQRAKASNLAYNYLREYSANTGASCSSAVIKSYESLPTPPDGLSNVFVSVGKVCPNASIPSLSKINVTVYYGDGKIVSHAIYAR